MDELFDLINENDEIIGQTSRKEAHAKSLLHRLVHVVVKDSEGKLLCLKRGEKVDTRPGFISNCAEHVKQGESYEACARRALKEELGVDAQAEFKEKIIVKDGSHNQLIACFVAKSEGPFRIDTTELASAEFKKTEEIKQGIKKGEKYTPTFIAVFEKMGKAKP